MFQGMEYVYAVYKEKSFSKAAQKLFISQPSLSANVKREEDSIGYPIFDRSTRPLSLTEPGRKYIETVEAILTRENEFSEYMNDWVHLRTGKLRLGGSSLYSSWVLPAMMGTFSRRYPKVHLELWENSTQKLEKMLQDGELDLMLDNCELDPLVFDRQLYQKEQLVLAVPKRFAINRGLEEYQITDEQVRDGSFLKEEVRAVDLGQFRDQPFIGLKPEYDTRQRANELCRQYDFSPRMIFELDQQMTSYNITCSGMGVSFICNTLISHAPVSQDVVYYKLSGEVSRRNLYFYWKRGRYVNRIMEEFLKTAGLYRSQETMV